jgi:hypothetical protein
MPSNTFISHGYYARAWNNKAELKLVDGQFVFVYRDHAPIRVANSVFDVHTFVNMAHLNMILRQAWNYYELESAKPPADPDVVSNNAAARARLLLRTFGECEIRARECGRRNLGTVDETAYVGQKSSQHLSDLEELCSYQTHPKLRYVLSPIYICDCWNLSGVIRAAAGAISGVQQLAESDRVVALTVTVARRAEIADIFGGVEDGALCWFILRRISIDSAGNYGPFQYVPYASAQYDYPPDDAMMYRDLAGNWARGIAFYVGRITLVPPGYTGRKVSRNATDLASGKRFSTDLEQHRRATAVLDTCTIQLFD